MGKTALGSFVQSEAYGTRASTVVLQDKNGMIKLSERSLVPAVR